jgi:hypothetical protein
MRATLSNRPGYKSYIDHQFDTHTLKQTMAAHPLQSWSQAAIAPVDAVAAEADGMCPKVSNGSVGAPTPRTYPVTK